MSSRCLTIQIDSTGLRTLAAAGQVVALVKSTTNPRYAVVWQVVHPVQQSRVSWAGAYQVYASTTALAAGVSLQTVASRPAAEGNTYSFTDGQFSSGTAGTPSQIAVRNQDYQLSVAGVRMIIAGVSETALVNSYPVTSPLDAQATPYGQTAVSILSDVVQVFPAGGVVAGTVLERGWLDSLERHADVDIVLGAPLEVDFTSNPDQTIHYNDATNAFAPGCA